MFDLDAAAWSSLCLSLTVALTASIAALVPALASGWLLARVQFPGRRLIELALHLPLVLPPVTVGYLLMRLLGSRGLLGAPLREWFGVRLPFTWYGAVLAAAVVGFPLFVRAVRLAVEMVDPGLEDAARTLGCGRTLTTLTVTLPLALPGIAAGFVLCFARSLGEFGATILFAGNIEGETRTLPLAMYTTMSTPGGEQAALHLALLSVVLSLAALGIGDWLSRRSTTRARRLV